MDALYQDWRESESAVIRTAGEIAQNRKASCRLSPLVMMSDPHVHENVVASAKAMPRGAAIIYRHFGDAKREEIAARLQEVTFARDQQLLIGNDPELAITCGADGVHFKRDATLAAPRLWRARCPDWLISKAGMKGDDDEGYIDYSGDLSVLDGLMVSSVFASDSSSAGNPIGLKRLLTITAMLGAPIYALGGVNERTAEALEGCGLSGIAGRFNSPMSSRT
jgi:thiamine-phosphate pyrophosphorylase